VEGARRFLGVVAAHDLLNAVEEETTNEMLRLVGAGTYERLTSTSHYSVRTRLRWLLVSLFFAARTKKSRFG
jgi:Mg/Co/Ni transporter MgtE